MEKVPETILVDARNIGTVLPVLVAKIQKANLVGFDIETDNRNAHAGILKLESKKVVFDHRRTLITGASFWCDGDDVAYYLNLNHADVGNRLSWDCLKACLDAKSANACWVIHNAPFELTMLKSVYGYDLTNVICSMQLCVTAYNSDTYPMHKFMTPGIGGIAKIMPIIARAFVSYRAGEPMTPEQEELLMKVIAKESDAEHSYNGYVKSIRYGYGLKEAVKSWFEFTMTTYAETLKAHGAERMGDLTGEQVAKYGADDAFWCVKLYTRVLGWLMNENPAAIETFFVQENPMVHVYSDTWLNGWRVDRGAIEKKKMDLRVELAVELRKLKAALLELLPFPSDPHPRLMERDPWYAKNFTKYRGVIEGFARLPDSAEDYKQCQQVRSPISNEWAEESGDKASSGQTIGHYMPVRTTLYDLCGFRYQSLEGKTQSDTTARAAMLAEYCQSWAKDRGVPVESVFKVEKGTVTGEDLAKDPRVRVMLAYQAIAVIEQVSKLYINNYICLTDPDTCRMYPTMSCLLDTRRMALANPGANQLSKNSNTVFVRGFFLADDDDSVLVSADWSSQEIALLASESQDPLMVEAFSTRPPQDFHTGTAAMLAGCTPEEVRLRPDFKELRRTAKSATFGGWYALSLYGVGAKEGWSPEMTKDLNDRYFETYATAYNWAKGVISDGAVTGHTELVDHLRRYRFEGTQQWADVWRAKLAPYHVPGFTELMIRKVQKRVGNQLVNFRIQGLAATVAKRTMLKVRGDIQEKNWSGKARLVIWNHDEGVYSVRKEVLSEFLDLLYARMIEGGGVMRNCYLDSSLAIGRSFQPYDPVKAPFGQIELSEINKGLPCVSEDRWGKKATEDERVAIAAYLLRG